MTTNITAIEALEQIDTIIVNAELANEVQLTLMICDIRKLIAQTLAPQECDAKESQLFKQDMFNFFVQEHGLHLLDGQMNDIIHFIHKYYLDEQLRSQEKTSLNKEGFKVYLKETTVPGGYIVTSSTEPQQKTFTIREIEEKFIKRIKKVKYESYSPALQLTELFAEFEKEVK